MNRYEMHVGKNNGISGFCTEVGLAVVLVNALDKWLYSILMLIFKWMKFSSNALVAVKMKQI